MLKTPLQALLALLALLAANARGDEHNEYRIRKTKEFITFSEEVNTGNDFSGTTVLLDADLLFTEEMSLDFEPIGKGTTNYFRGVFDGQGHTLSDLSVQFRDQYVGLFGYARGVTIRNLVLDATCTVNGTFDATTLHVGGILSFCDSFHGDCLVESAVVLGSVHGEVPLDAPKAAALGNVFLGGVAGRLETQYSFSEAQLTHAAVRNSAFYGALAYTRIGAGACVGGVVGYAAGGSALNRVRVENSLMAGTITDNVNNAALNIGGIVGLCGAYTAVENCANSGHIIGRAADTEHRIGGIAVLEDPDTVVVKHSFWTDGVSFAGTAGSSSSTAAATALGEDLVIDLNIYASPIWNGWLYNPQNSTVTFKVTQGRTLALKAPLILLPGLTEGWRHFVGWFTDAQFTKEFTAQSVSTDTTLYGLWDKYLVTLDPNGGTSAQQYAEVSYNVKYPAIPDPVRSKATFDGWNTAADESGDRVSKSTVCTRSFDHTVYAQWIIKRFYVKFNMSAGNVVEQEVIYTDPIVYPAAPEREGFRFIGWDKTVAEMPEHNVTINAVWEEITEAVEFGITGKGGEMKESDVKAFVEKIAVKGEEEEEEDVKFEIRSVEFDERAGVTTVIVRFPSVEGAEKFVGKAEAEKNVVDVKYVPRDSLSAVLAPIFSVLFSFL